VNDAGQDRDLDWVSNFQEYQNGLNPLLADSNSDGTNDYATLTGKNGARYTYDRIDRLTGVEYERGFSIAYVYDGNGNLLRQYYLERDEDGDGLPDLWEFQNGLSWTNAQGTQGLTGDADGDGWSNWQEWQGRGNPTNPASRPDIFGVAPATATVFNVGFAATRFTMAAGQLDGGGDEIAVGADGNPGGVTNVLLVLSPTFTGWTTQRVTVGTVGITSLAIGQPTNTASPSIYLGTRQAGGTGAILRVSQSGGGWTNETLAVSTNDSAFVLGIRTSRDVLVSIARSNQPPSALTSLTCSNGTWLLTTLDTNASQRGLGTVGFATGNDAIGGGLRLLNTGGIQLAASNATPILITEPPATNRLLWSGRSLASGAIRGGGSSSVLYQYIEDANSNGVADANDSVVLFEAELSGTNGIQRTLRKTTLTGSSLATTYSLACVNLTNGTGRILFTAEPDGGIYSWTPPTSTGALVRQAFALHRVGSAWHDLSAYRPMTPGEGMAGLNVDTATPATCRVMTWQPDNQLWTPAAIPQTAPITRVLPDPNSGAGLSLVKVKIWDAEGNRSLPILQYLDPASSNWRDATVLTLDGNIYSYALAVEAAPTGSTHSFVWNSGSDLGVTFTNNILLRSRSVDITLWGDWSEPVLYRIEGSTDSDKDGMPDTWELSRNLNPLDATGDSGAGADPDGDGMRNIDEYTADTDPLDGDSLLTITGVRTDPAGLRIDWKGGSMAWQYIQTRVSLVETGETWSSIHTVSPPTPTSNYVIDAGATNSSLFYRIKAER
jgi:YD repeat-containing protein